MVKRKELKSIRNHIACNGGISCITDRKKRQLYHSHELIRLCFITHFGILIFPANAYTTILIGLLASLLRFNLNKQGDVGRNRKSVFPQYMVSSSPSSSLLQGQFYSVCFDLSQPSM